MATMKRKDYRRLRVGLIVLALCLVVSAIPFAVNMFSPRVSAVNYTVSNGSWDTLKSNIESVTNGVTGNITVTSNISTGFGDPIQVKSGAIINLTVNEGITVERTSGDGWNNIYGRMFYVNSGATLNIKGKGTLRLYYFRDVSCDYDKSEYGSSSIVLITNDGGTVNIGSTAAADAPNLVAFDHLEYTDIKNGGFLNGAKAGYGVTFNWCAGVWNLNDNSTANMYSGLIDADCYGRGAISKDGWAGEASNGGARTFDYCYGILNGKAYMNGGSIDVHTNCYFSGHRAGAASNNFDSYVYGGGISYGILSDNIHMVNGNIRTDTWADANGDNHGKKGGRLTLFSAGLAYYSTTPTVDGGTVRASTDYATLHGDLPKTRNSGPVVRTPSSYYYLPSYYSVSVTQQGSSAFDDAFGSQNYGFYPTNASDLAAGTSKDSNGRTQSYTTNAASSSMDRGVNSAGNTNAKTMLVYRYYDEDGNLTSYGPTRNTGISNASSGTVATATNVAANANINNNFTPGNAANLFQYELKKVSYASYSSADGGYPATANIPLDTIWQKTDTSTIWEYRYFGAEHNDRVETTSNSTTAPQSSYIFIYLDYHKMPVEQLTFSPLANGTFEYDAEALTKEDLQLTAASNGTLVGDNTYTNIAGYPQTNILDAAFSSTSTNENSFTYQYYGTRADGTVIAEADAVSGLPKDAGSWTIKYNLPANTAKNRAACTGTFGVTITPATPGFVDKSYTVTYSTPLSAIPLYNTSGTGIAEAATSAFLGDFDYTWGDENTAYTGATLPTVAQSGSAFKVVATPKSGKEFNYLVDSDDFNVAVTVNPLKVAVNLNGASVVYGAEFDPADYISGTPGGNDFTVHGSAADGTALSGALKTELVDAVKGLVQVVSGTNAVTYTPGETLAGSYTMTLATTSGPITGTNFYINSVNNTATLSVAPRNMTVYVGPTGDAASVTYAKDPVTGNVVNSASYTFTPSDFAIEGIDDEHVHIADVFGTHYSLANVTYNYPNGGNVGSGEVILPNGTTLTLTGTKAGCYNISAIVCRTITITKATPKPSDYTAPTIASAVYDPLRTLADVAAENPSTVNSSGTFVPKNPDAVPQAGSYNYLFVYTPTDTANYETVDVPVTVPVTKRTVTVTGSYQSASITYGMPAPASADYTWSFSGWTGKSGTVDSYLVDNGGEILMVGNIAGLAPANYTTMHLTSNYTPATDAGTTVTVAVDGTFNLTSDNYNFTFTGDTFTVAKKELKIVAPDATAVYGEIPAADATLVRYVDSEGNEIPGAADLFTESYTQSIVFKYVKTDSFTGASYDRFTDGVGSYYIFASYGNETLTNYYVTRQSGTLTVVPKAVHLVPQDMTIDFTDDAPTAFTYLPEDPNVDASAVFSGSIAATTNYVKGNNVGTYNILTACNADGTYTAAQQPDLVVDPNYTVTLGASAILTVQKAVLPAETVQTAINALGALSYVYNADTTLQQAQRNADMDTVSFTYNGVPVEGAITFARANDVINVSDSGSNFVVTFSASGANADNFWPVATGLYGTVNVTPATITGTLQLGGQLMVTGHVYPDLSGVNPSNVDYYTYQWAFADDPSTVISTRRSLLLEERDGVVYEGKQLVLTITVRTAIDNYVGTLTITTDPVSPQLPTLNQDWIIRSYENTVVYDAQGHVATVAFDASRLGEEDVPYTGEFTVKYNGETAVPVNVGTYIISYDATSDGVYASEYGTFVGTMTITKRDLTVSFAVNDKVYDGTTKATFVNAETPAVIADGLCSEDASKVELNTRNARVAFVDYNCGDAVAADLSGVYLLGEKADNYNLIEGTSTARISPAPVTAAVGMRTPIVDYSAGLANPETAGLIAYFYNITGVMSRDRSTFRIANDTTVGVLNPAAGVCSIDMSTISAVGNNANYEITVVTDALTITVNKITSPYIAGLPNGLALDSRPYDSRAHLTNEELQAYIAARIGDEEEAKAFTWALVDGETPVPEVSNTGSAKQYTVNYESTDGNYRTATIRVAVPVTPKAIILTAGSTRVRYGDPVPELTYTVSDGALYEDETLLSVFGVEPTVTTTYVQYSPVNATTSPYYVTVNAAQLRSSNYTIATRTGTIHVTKAPLSATAYAEDKVYNGVANDIVVRFSDLNGVLRDSDDVYLPASVTGMVANADAGRNKTVSFTVPALQGAAAGNYSLTITNRTQVKINIDKASLESAGITYTFPTAASIEYGQSVGQAVYDGEQGDGTFAYVLASDVPANIGVYNTYEMRFTPTDNTNYDSVTQIVPLTVTNAYVRLEPVISGGTYVGDTLTVTIPGVPSAMMQYITITWYREDENGARQPIGEATGSTYTLTSEDVNSRIAVTLSVDSASPYQPTDGSVFETVSSFVKEIQMSFWQRIFSWWARLLKAIQTLFRGR